MLIIDLDAQHTFTDDPFNSLASQFAEFFFSNNLQPISDAQFHSDTAISNMVDTCDYLYLIYIY